MASATAPTIRSISSAVDVSIGISTTTSPSGRMSTPRRTQRRRHLAAPAQAVGRGELDAGHQPASAHVAHGGRRVTTSAEQRRAVRPAPHVGEHVHSLDRAADGAGATRRRRVPRVASGRGRACAPRGRGRGTRRRPAAGDGGRHRQVAAGDALAEAAADRGARRTARLANSVPVRPKPVATSSQISSTPCARQASATARTNSGLLSAMPAAPCTSGSSTTAASRSACTAIASVPRRAPTSGERTTGKRSGSKTSVPNPPSPTDSEPMVSPWYAPPKRGRSCARHALVGPVLEGDLQRLFDRGGAVGREQEVRPVDRHDRPAPRPAR